MADRKRDGPEIYYDVVLGGSIFGKATKVATSSFKSILQVFLILPLGKPYFPMVLERNSDVRHGIRAAGDAVGVSQIIFVSVGNILDSADVRSTGALEPPDFVFSKCRELEVAAPTAF